MSRTHMEGSGERGSNKPIMGWATKSLVEMYTWNSTYSPLLDCDVSLPRSNLIEVSHVSQLHNWDCGLACVLMVLRALGINGCSLKTLTQLCRNTSIWTVDLAYLLRHFSVDVAFLTVTLGANPLLAVESFYKDNMAIDEQRVNRLFEKAPQAGIQIQWRSISGEELAMLILSGRYLAIALVDKRKLSHPWLEDLCLSECCGLNPGFTGHYIVICGYDLETNEFEIRDPSSSSDSDKLSMEALDEARKSFGTDEDLLLISMDSLESSIKAMAMLSINNEEKTKTWNTLSETRRTGASLCTHEWSTVSAGLQRLEKDHQRDVVPSPMDNDDGDFLVFLQGEDNMYNFT